MRGYSIRIQHLNEQANASKLGVRLGRLCIEKDIPVTVVAKRLKVSRATIYNWFCGVSSPQDAFAPRVQAYITELESSAP